MEGEGIERREGRREDKVGGKWVRGEEREKEEMKDKVGEEGMRGEGREKGGREYEGEG